MVVMAVVMSTFCGSGVVQTTDTKSYTNFGKGAGRGMTRQSEGVIGLDILQYSLYFLAKVRHFSAARHGDAARMHEMRRYKEGFYIF